LVVNGDDVHGADHRFFAGVPGIGCGSGH
jgi:hypothetical protein